MAIIQLVRQHCPPSGFQMLTLLVYAKLLAFISSLDSPALSAPFTVEFAMDSSWGHLRVGNQCLYFCSNKFSCKLHLSMPLILSRPQFSFAYLNIVCVGISRANGRNIVECKYMPLMLDFEYCRQLTRNPMSSRMWVKTWCWSQMGQAPPHRFQFIVPTSQPNCRNISPNPFDVPESSTRPLIHVVDPFALPQDHVEPHAHKSFQRHWKLGLQIAKQMLNSLTHTKNLFSPTLALQLHIASQGPRWHVAVKEVAFNVLNLRVKEWTLYCKFDKDWLHS